MKLAATQMRVKSILIQIEPAQAICFRRPSLCVLAEVGNLVVLVLDRGGRFPVFVVKLIQL